MSHQSSKIVSIAPATRDFKAPTFDNSKIVLYFHPYNFYSQKVLMVLYEKNIDFAVYVVDLSNGEQYSQWFLNLNPRGDVPVLQDGALILPNSANIINYVESKFRCEKYQLLKPYTPESYQYKQMMMFERLCAGLPIGALSLGSFIHDDLKLVPKAPFIGPVRQTCLKNNEKVLELLRTCLRESDALNNELKHKLNIQLRRKDLVTSRTDFQSVLNAVAHALQYVENELDKKKPNIMWLTGNDFTLADVSFGLLLQRLHQLGFENYYWTNGKLPLVENFFFNFRQRPSYLKIMPSSNIDILMDIWTMTPANYKIGATAGILGVAMLAAFAHK